jgi:thioredoxin-dependent peroxiredoxin
MSIERANAFDFHGPRSLVGPELKPGDKAPDFTLLKSPRETVSLADFHGKPLLISVVPSLDTSTCSRQTHQFNQQAASLGDAASFVAVSADLPFAQARWCGAEDVTNIQTLSDHREMSFGEAYGTYVRDLRIESRAVFVVDTDGTLRYVEYVPVAGQEPNYEAVLATLKEII